LAGVTKKATFSCSSWPLSRGRRLQETEVKKSTGPHPGPTKRGEEQEQEIRPAGESSASPTSNTVRVYILNAAELFVAQFILSEYSRHTSRFEYHQTKLFTSHIERDKEHHTKLSALFAARGVDFDTEIYPQFLDIYYDFVSDLAATIVVQETVTALKKRVAPYAQHMTVLTKKEAPLPSDMKEMLRWVRSNLESDRIEQRLQDAIRKLWGQTRRLLDPDLTKSPHKHPAFVAFADAMYKTLTEKGITGYTAARLLLHPLFTTYCIIPDKTPSPGSFHRNILRQ
jgi:hypothetical protein